VPCERVLGERLIIETGTPAGKRRDYLPKSSPPRQSSKYQQLASYEKWQRTAAFGERCARDGAGTLACGCPIRRLAAMGRLWRRAIRQLFSAGE
jgi:hypothetical protein